MADLPQPRPLTDMPVTDDPVVLRELLRQAREQLRMHASFEHLMADNVARTEALLLEARSAAPGGGTPDLDTIRTAVASIRRGLTDALQELQAVEQLLGHEPDTGSHTVAISESSSHTAPTGPMTVEVLVHNVPSPALARSLQTHLQSLETVSRADVRELAEGILRITVETSTPLTARALAAWEPDRKRTIRTERADVLEIALTE